MACCCKSCKSTKSSSICLGRCTLPKHRCLLKESVKPGPIPKHQGWLYNAKNSPHHQLRCGWRPGHVSTSVLKMMQQHKCYKSRECLSMPPVCKPSKPCGSNILSLPIKTCTCCAKPGGTLPLIRIIRHAGQYTICTKPSKTNTSPSGPYPLKYILNTDPNDQNEKETGVRYSVEAKFNNYNFDYTSSQSSFVIDFSPPQAKCIPKCISKCYPNCMPKCP